MRYTPVFGRASGLFWPLNLQKFPRRFFMIAWCFLENYGILILIASGAETPALWRENRPAPRAARR